MIGTPRRSRLLPVECIDIQHAGAGTVRALVAPRTWRNLWSPYRFTVRIDWDDGDIDELQDVERSTAQRVFRVAVKEMLHGQRVELEGLDTSLYAW